jgi:hypothetical protein
VTCRQTHSVYGPRDRAVASPTAAFADQTLDMVRDVVLLAIYAALTATGAAADHISERLGHFRGPQPRLRTILVGRKNEGLRDG